MYTSDLRNGENRSIVNELAEIDPGAIYIYPCSEASDEEQKFCLLNLGGAGVTIDRTFALTFQLAI